MCIPFYTCDGKGRAEVSSRQYILPLVSIPGLSTTFLKVCGREVWRGRGREGGQVFCKAEMGYQDNLKPQHFLRTE